MITASRVRACVWSHGHLVNWSLVTVTMVMVVMCYARACVGIPCTLCLVPCALGLHWHWYWIGDWIRLVLDWIAHGLGLGFVLGDFAPISHGHNAGFGHIGNMHHIGHMVHMYMDHTDHVGARSPHRAKVRQPARATGNTVPSHMRPIWA